VVCRASGTFSEVSGVGVTSGAGSDGGVATQTA
jgi:hypothetical protein